MVKIRTENPYSELLLKAKERDVIRFQLDANPNIIAATYLIPHEDDTLECKRGELADVYVVIEKYCPEEYMDTDTTEAEFWANAISAECIHIALSYIADSDPLLLNRQFDQTYLHNIRMGDDLRVHADNSGIVIPQLEMRYSSPKSLE